MGLIVADGIAKSDLIEQMVDKKIELRPSQNHDLDRHNNPTGNRRVQFLRDNLTYNLSGSTIKKDAVHIFLHGRVTHAMTIKTREHNNWRALYNKQAGEVLDSVSRNATGGTAVGAIQNNGEDEQNQSNNVSRNATGGTAIGDIQNGEDDQNQSDIVHVGS